MRSGIEWHDMEQGSPEWFEIKLGRISGTSAKELLVKGKGEGGLGVGAWSLIYQLAGEIITGETPPNFDNYWTERGKAMESLAIEAYEDATFNLANRVGFISWGKYAGVSPDFMVDENKGGEVKCLSAKEHLRYAHTREIEKDYMAQIQWALFVTGFESWDYVHFHPNCGAASLIIDTITPDYDMHGVFSDRMGVVIKATEEVVKLATMPK